MAYIKPTLSDFRTRYPAFATVADATVQAWLDDGDEATAAWPDDNRFRAVMLFAAHNLSLSGVLTGGQSLTGVTSFRSGSFSATLSDAAASRTGFAATTYGQDYLLLRRSSFALPMTAWSPPAVYDA